MTWRPEGERSNPALVRAGGEEVAGTEEVRMRMGKLRKSVPYYAVLILGSKVCKRWFQIMGEQLWP